MQGQRNNEIKQREIQKKGKERKKFFFQKRKNGFNPSSERRQAF
jgi:hypothetical protein